MSDYNRSNNMKCYLLATGGIMAGITQGCMLFNKDGDDQRPNILFCLADDITWSHMSAYGCKWINTPSFDYVAQNGILFTNAYTPNAKCSPSRACILTGRNSWQLEEAANHMAFFPSRFKTVAEALSENGYFTGYTGKGWVPGIAKYADGTPRELLVKKYGERKMQPPTSEISTDDYTGNFKDFLDDKPNGQPFFFWYGGWEPHRAYEYGSGIEIGNMVPSQIDKVPPFWPDVDSVRIDMLDYAYEIQYFDMHLGQILEELKLRGELHNTLIIVTSDNGMPFPRVKGQSYEMSNHLPLAIMWPAGIRKTGRIINDFVSFIDFVPTFLEVAGINEANSGMASITGKSLTNLLSSRKDGHVDPLRKYVLIGKERHDVGRPNDWGYPIRGIRSDSLLYIVNYKTDRWPAGNPETGYLNCDGSPTKTVCLETRKTTLSRYWQLNFGMRQEEELYNIVNDPFCMVNLSESDEYLDRKLFIADLMNMELKKQGDPRILGNDSIFDQYKVAFDNLRGYYGRFFRGETGVVDWVNLSDYEKNEIE